MDHINKINEEGGAGDWGTDKARARLQKDTPYQKIDSFKEFMEKAVSVKQQKLFGLALAYKRGDVSDSEVSQQIKDMAKNISTKDLEDFAKTKHKGLPQKK